MDISSIGSLTNLNKFGMNSITSPSENNNSTFESMFQAAVNLINDTNSTANAAKEAEISYALGLTDNTSDLMVAQQKANLSLQYTVAIRNNIMEAYKEIMNLQF